MKQIEVAILLDKLLEVSKIAYKVIQRGPEKDSANAFMLLATIQEVERAIK